MTLSELTPQPFIPATDGIFAMPDPDYRAAVGVSQSMLKDLRISPAHLMSSITEPKKPTRAMMLGNFTEHALLEPDRLVNAYYVKPEDMKFSTTPGKAWLAEHSDRFIISAEEERSLVGMSASVLAHPIARAIIEGGFTQVSLFCHHAPTGLLRKGRLDKLLLDAKERPAIGDLKTCVSASPRGFNKAVTNEDYHIQDAYYSAMLEDLIGESPSFVFIAVEKTPPYPCATYQLGYRSRSSARKEFERDLALYKECQDKAAWPAYGDQIITIELPNWKLDGLSPIIPD